jgi:SAM-dependent methyltransferase
VEELSRYYPDEYFPDPDQSAALRLPERKKLALVKLFCSQGSLLDIGAGIGLFVREATDAGFAAEGIEISRQAVEHGKRSLGIQLTAGDLLDLPIPSAAYDVVTLWHVLEHLPYPHAALQKISRILRNSGTLILAVPNVGSLQARVFRSRWFHLDVPRHLFHYTPATLARVLNDAGFEVRQTIFRHREHDPAGILGSIIRLSAPGESFLHKLLRKAIGMPAATLLAAGEALAFGESGTFITVARIKSDR